MTAEKKRNFAPLLSPTDHCAMQNDDRKMGSQPWLLVQSAQKARSRTTVGTRKADYMDKKNRSLDTTMSIKLCPYRVLQKEWTV